MKTESYLLMLTCTGFFTSLSLQFIDDLFQG